MSRSANSPTPFEATREDVRIAVRTLNEAPNLSSVVLRQYVSDQGTIVATPDQAMLREIAASAGFTFQQTVRQDRRGFLHVQSLARSTERQISPTASTHESEVSELSETVLPLLSLACLL